jgi:hypothetical protein
MAGKRRETPDYDGKIKAPPAAGVHVVGWIEFSCRLPPMPCCRSTQKSSENQLSQRRRTYQSPPMARREGKGYKAAIS